VKTGVGLAHLSRHLTKTINDKYPFKKVRNISSITSACCSNSSIDLGLVSFQVISGEIGTDAAGYSNLVDRLTMANASLWMTNRAERRHVQSRMTLSILGPRHICYNTDFIILTSSHISEIIADDAEKI